MYASIASNTTVAYARRLYERCRWPAKQHLGANVIWRLRWTHPKQIVALCSGSAASLKQRSDDLRLGCSHWAWHWPSCSQSLRLCSSFHALGQTGCHYIRQGTCCLHIANHFSKFIALYGHHALLAQQISLCAPTLCSMALRQYILADSQEMSDYLSGRILACVEFQAKCRQMRTPCHQRRYGGACKTKEIFLARAPHLQATNVPCWTILAKHEHDVAQAADLHSEHLAYRSQVFSIGFVIVDWSFVCDHDEHPVHQVFTHQFVPQW